MKYPHSATLLPLWIALLASPCRLQQRFPELKIAYPHIIVEGSWARAENVVVGNVSNIMLMGYQEAQNLPAPLSAGVHEIRWCEADFHAVAAIKGKMPDPGKKYVWGTVQQECRLGEVFGYGDAETPVTRVWFLREERDYLRPAVDEGGPYYVSFHTDWENVPASAARRAFVLLLLDPAALSLAPEDHDRLFNGIEIARSILEPAEFVLRLNALAARYPATLQDAIKGYLNAVAREAQR